MSESITLPIIIFTCAALIAIFLTGQAGRRTPEDRTSGETAK
jgi:hypothetical protein